MGQRMPMEERGRSFLNFSKSSFIYRFNKLKETLLEKANGVLEKRGLSAINEKTKIKWFFISKTKEEFFVKKEMLQGW